MIESIVKYAPTLATLFFFLFFCVIVYYVFKKGNNKKFTKYSQIPLNDEEFLNKKNNK